MAKPAAQFIERHHHVLAIGWSFTKLSVPGFEMRQRRSVDAHLEIAIERGTDREISQAEIIAAHEGPLRQVPIQHGEMRVCQHQM